MSAGNGNAQASIGTKQKRPSTKPGWPPFALSTHKNNNRDHHVCRTSDLASGSTENGGRPTRNPWHGGWKVRGQLLWCRAEAGCCHPRAFLVLSRLAIIASTHSTNLSSL